MQTTIATVRSAFIAITALAAAGLAQAAPQKVVEQLPRVVVTGKSVQTVIVQLPRVVIEGRSLASSTQLAAAKPTARRG